MIAPQPENPLDVYRPIIKEAVNAYYGKSVSAKWKDYVTDVINVVCNNTVVRRKKRDPDTPTDAIITYVYREYMNCLFDKKSATGKEIMKNLRSKTFDAENLVDMKTTQLFPELFEEEMKEINLRLDQKVQKRHTTLYKCRRCGKRETVAQQIYIKMKADEAVSFDVECVSCGNRWIVT